MHVDITDLTVVRKKVTFDALHCHQLVGSANSGSVLPRNFHKTFMKGK